MNDSQKKDLKFLRGLDSLDMDDIQKAVKRIFCENGLTPQEKDELIALDYENYRKKVDTYRDEIITMEALVKFAYDHCTEAAAAEAIREFVKETMGIEVDEKAARLEEKLENGEDILDGDWKKRNKTGNAFIDFVRSNAFHDWVGEMCRDINENADRIITELQKGKNDR